LHVFSKVEIASEATVRFESVMRFSSSLWQKETSCGCLVAILFITRRAAYLFTGLVELVAS
jgi:hypothetical protein